MSIRMNAKLRPNELLSTRQPRQAAVSNQADLPLGEVAAERAKRREAVTYGRNLVVAKWLDEALSNHPKAAAVASDCGISEAYLSQMRAGERTIPAHLLLSLLEWTPAATALLTAMAEHNGKLAIVPIRNVSPEVARKRQLAIIQGIPELYAMVRRRAADDLGTTEDMIDWSNEDTDVRATGVYR